MATVFVKIAVAVDPEGKWNAVGWSEEGALVGADCMDAALAGLGDGSGEARYWVTAVLHVPETEAVEGKVEPA